MDMPIPTEIVLKASPLKWGGMLLLTILFTLGGFWALSDEEHKLAAWITILLFGVIGIPVSLFQLIRPARLTLNENGFEQVMMGRTVKCNWEDVSDFGIFRTGKTKFVSFSNSRDEGKLMAQISSTLTRGHSGALGDTFGMKAQDLADLMNAFRARALNN